MAARLHRNEYMGMLGGALLAVSVFLPWYSTDSDNRFANIDGERGDQSCFDVHPILRWLLLAAAVAPFILAYIIANDIIAKKYAKAVTGLPTQNAIAWAEAEIKRVYEKS